MHRSRASVRFLLPLLIGALVAIAVAPASGLAATRAELEAHRKKAADARKQAAAADRLAKKLADEIAALDGQIETLEREARSLEPRIAQASRRTLQLRREVAELEAEARALAAEIERTRAELDTQRALLAERVESTYKQGTWYYLDVLLGSESLVDLIARTELVARVMEANSAAAASLRHTEERLEKTEAKLERSLENARLKQQQAEAVERELVSLKHARERAAQRREQAQTQKARLLADTKRNAARLRALAEQEEAESARIAAELAGNGSGVFAGTMSWPVPASRRITSPFGPRICPFHGRELHPGIDIGRPSAGADWPESERAVVAAADGTVISAGYRGGYGNTIIIDHGNGVTTLYAHLASGGILVSTGQSVSRGERIGTVGSTGNSTGPHLHFEVRVNGEPRNPMGYF